MTSVKWDAFVRWAFSLAVLIYLVLFSLNSLTRLRQFSPDSMNYVDVARNVIAGRGIAQSTLGFNQPHWNFQTATGAAIPTPLTSQPPIYPLLIALFGVGGLSLADAALLVPVLSYGLVLLLTWLLARELYDDGVALLSTACLLVYLPLHFVASFAWSEAVAMAFVSLSFWLLARTRHTFKQRIYIPLFAGLAVGLAFATRYAFLPAFFLGLVLLIEPKDWRWTARSLALYAAGFVLLAGWVIGRSLIFDGTLLGPSRNVSLRGLSANWDDLINSTFKMYLDQNRVSPSMQYLAFRLSLLAMGLVLLWRRRLGETLEGVFLGGKAYLLAFWGFGYLAFLLYQRTGAHFDQIGPRLIVPGGAVLVVLWVALLVRTFRLPARYLVYPALLLAFLAIFWEAQTLALMLPRSEAQVIALSERLCWIKENTTDRDLIIGDDTMDIPFYLGRTSAVSFSPYPYTDYPEYTQFMTFVQAHCRSDEAVNSPQAANPTAQIFLVLRNRYRDDLTAWRFAYGPFVADLMQGQTLDYPGIVYRRRLSDGYVFEVQCAK